MGSIMRFVQSLFSLPPHEFAYGTQLSRIEDLSGMVHRILSLEFFDPNKTRIEVSSLGGSNKINSLLGFCSQLAKTNPRLESLLTSLREIEKLDAVQEQATRGIDKLVEYRAELRDESKQDEVIMFLHYSFKQPQSLDAGVRETLNKLVERVDTPKELRKFNSKSCPNSFLEGNINIYPRLIENTSWYDLGNFESADRERPILELRFMGLGGVFVYILNQIEHRFGCTFFHLDGNSVDAYRQGAGPVV